MSTCSRQDFFLGLKRDDVINVKNNLVPIMRRPPIGSASIRSASSEASTGFQDGRSHACFDQPCALSCPTVKRDTNVQRWMEESVHEVRPFLCGSA